MRFAILFFIVMTAAILGFPQTANAVTCAGGSGWDYFDNCGDFFGSQITCDTSTQNYEVIWHRDDCPAGSGENYSDQMWYEGVCSSSCTPPVTPTPTPSIPLCNSGGSCSPCTGAPPNTCYDGNGTCTYTYTTLLGGGSCTLQSVPNIGCIQQNCSAGNSCVGASCVGPAPTNTPTPNPVFYLVQGAVWNDNNNDGVIDGTDTVRSGNSVVVKDITGGGSQSVVTDGIGVYTTSQIFPDRHLVSAQLQNPPAGCSVFPGNPSNGFITGSNLTLSFGVYCPSPTPTGSPTSTPTGLPTSTPTPTPSGPTPTPNSNVCSTIPICSVIAPGIKLICNDLNPFTSYTCVKPCPTDQLKCLSSTISAGEKYTIDGTEYRSVCCNNPPILNLTLTPTPAIAPIPNEVNTAIGPISTNPQGFVTKVFSVVLGLAGGIALILIMLSGYRFMTSQGNPEKLTEAREQLTSAIVGLLFIIFAFVILEVIGVDLLNIPGFSH